jgi:hypothetical protein
MNTIKKLLIISLCVLMLFALTTAFATDEADPYSLYVVLNDEAVPSAKEGEANTSHIKLLDGYLYLPSMTDMSKVKLCFVGDGELKIKADKSGGKSATFKSGDFVDIKHRLLLYYGSSPLYNEAHSLCHSYFDMLSSFFYFFSTVYRAMDS